MDKIVEDDGEATVPQIISFYNKGMQYTISEHIPWSLAFLGIAVHRVHLFMTTVYPSSDG